MTVLVAVASRHGATREIAEAIARTLAAAGVEAEVDDAEDVTDVSRYDAVVIGGGVYVGRWLAPARRFVELHADELALRPTWLFSSGPVGHPPKPEADEAVQIGELLELTGAREHRLFAGRLDKARLGFGERAIVRVVGATDGDFRDWDEIDAWARAIASELARRIALPEPLGSAGAR